MWYLWWRDELLNNKVFIKTMKLLSNKMSVMNETVNTGLFDCVFILVPTNLSQVRANNRKILFTSDHRDRLYICTMFIAEVPLGILTRVCKGMHDFSTVATVTVSFWAFMTSSQTGISGFQWRSCSVFPNMYCSERVEKWDLIWNLLFFLKQMSLEKQLWTEDCLR